MKNDRKFYFHGFIRYIFWSKSFMIMKNSKNIQNFEKFRKKNRKKKSKKKIENFCQKKNHKKNVNFWPKI